MAPRILGYILDKRWLGLKYTLSDEFERITPPMCVVFRSFFLPYSQSCDVKKNDCSVVKMVLKQN